jgi:lipopolysaccharide cholinephosphotransferase
MCEQHGLTYYASGGTLLGAVRHGGFIPWDDDIDVAMPREDYERFLEIAEGMLEGSIRLETYRNSPSYFRLAARMVDSTVQVTNRSFDPPRVEPAWIDVFPLDGWPDGALRGAVHKARLMSRKLLVRWANTENLQNAKVGRPAMEVVLMWVGRTLRLSRLLNVRNRLVSLEKALKRYPAKTASAYFNFNGLYGFKSIMEKSSFYGKGGTYEFEGLRVSGPEMFDAYLRRIYGDYMTPPPPEKRNSHNTTVIYGDTPSSVDSPARGDG